MALVALELANELSREKGGDLAVFYFPHLTDKVFIVFFDAEFRVVIQGVNGSLGLSFTVLGVQEFQQANQKLLGILLIVSLHNLNVLLNCQLERLVILSIFGVL